MTAVAVAALFFGTLAFSAESSPAASPNSLYAIGTAARERRDHAAAKAAFLKLLEDSPESGGALEGLSLACLALGEYEDASVYLQRWNLESPDNPYVLSLLAEAEKGVRDQDALRDTYLEIVDLQPYHFKARRGLDEIKENRDSGLFLRGRIYKSLGNEEINTPNPQRLNYEGRSGGLKARVRVSPRFSWISAAEVRQEAQRNDNRGFTYYDILEQIYWLGSEVRPNRNLLVKAQYGYEVMSDNKEFAVGRTVFHKAQLNAQLRALDADFRVSAARDVKFLRGGAQSRFFAILREVSARAEAEWYRGSWGFLARAGVFDYSEHTTQKSWSFQASDEIGDNLITPYYSRGQQEMYSARPNGHIGYVDQDSYGVRFRRRIEDFYQLNASYGRSIYRDGNRLHDISGEAKYWVPWHKAGDGQKDFSVGYRYDQLRYLTSLVRYQATNTLNHWLGVYWEPRNRRGFVGWVGYEHGFLRDTVREDYEGNAFLGEMEWYYRGDLALKAQGRVVRNNVGNQSYSLGLQARCSF